MLLQRDAVAQRIGGDIERKASGPHLIGQHVTGMAGVGTDFEKRGIAADKGGLLLQDSAAPLVLFGVNAAGAFGLAERGEVMELHLGALD